MAALEILEGSEEPEFGTPVGLYPEYIPADYCKKQRHHPGKLVESGVLRATAKSECSYIPSSPLVLDNPLISSAQLDAICLCCEQHEQMFSYSKFRCGFLLGDATGVGKSTTISGVLLENDFLGRKKFLWVTQNQMLCQQAQKELRKLGYKGCFFDWPFSSIEGDGVCFSTYKGLCTNKTALKDWLTCYGTVTFDSVIIFDEGHNAKTPQTSANTNFCRIQQENPHARVVYSSATAAGSVEDLSYAERLGLWGEGLPFEFFKDFRDKLKGNLDLMEVLAMELRSGGKYIAHSLSFSDCQFFIDQWNLTQTQRAIYDSCCDFWSHLREIASQKTKQSPQKTQEAFDEKEEHESGGFKAVDNKKNKNGKSIWSQFYGCQQRFYHALLCSFKAEKLPEEIRFFSSKNHSVVVGVQTTGDAAATSKKKSDKKSGTCPKRGRFDVNLSPCPQMLLDFIQKYMSKEKQSFEKMVDRLNLPENVIDYLLRELRSAGFPAAELTGRNERFEDGNLVRVYSIESERQLFQDSDRLVAIISDAASVEISLHASNDCKNTRRRVHLLLEFPWSAEKAVQQLGRTNRTNQCSGPRYMFCITDVPEEMRFCCAVTARVRSMGATTHGNRKLSKHLNLDGFGYFNKQGKEAVIRTIRDGHRFEYVDDLTSVGLGKFSILEQFFNRLLALKLPTQERIFNRFLQNYDACE